jgi:hypothetical protein
MVLCSSAVLDLEARVLHEHAPLDLVDYVRKFVSRLYD